MKKINLYSIIGTSIVNISKIGLLKNLIPTDKDFARRFLLVDSYKLSEVEPFFLSLDNETSFKFKGELIKKNSNYRSFGFENDPFMKKEYLPVFFSLPNLPRGIVGNAVLPTILKEKSNLLILKIYLS